MMSKHLSNDSLIIDEQMTTKKFSPMCLENISEHVYKTEHRPCQNRITYSDRTI